MVETDAERMYVKLQKRQGRTDQPHYVEVRMLEFVGGAVLVGNPPLEEVRRIQPFGPLVDQSGRAAWLFPDGSKLYVKNYRLHC